MLILIAAAQAVLVPAPAVQAAAPVQAATPAAAPVLLAQDTPVELMAVSEVNTDDAKPGHIFKLRVNRAVSVDGRVVVPVGAQAFGQVLTATDAGSLGKSGRMTAKLLHLRLGEAEVPLEGQTSAKGTGAGSTGVAVIFSGWMGLFHRGNNAKIKAGEILNGYVAEDVLLDLSAPIARRAPTATAAAQPVLTPAAVVTSPAPVQQ
jgi:hypothetical protein